MLQCQQLEFRIEFGSAANDKDIKSYNRTTFKLLYGRYHDMHGHVMDMYATIHGIFRTFENGKQLG